MKKMLLILVLALTSALPIFAADEAAEKTKLIDELLAVTQQEELMKKQFTMMRDMQQQRLFQVLAQRGITLSPEEKKKSDQVLAATQKIIEEEFSWEKLRPVIVAVYATNLSADTLKALNAFYRSPAGQEFLVKMPAIQQQLMNELQQPILELSKKLDAKVAELTAKNGEGK